MSTDDADSQQFSPEMTAVINEAYQSASELLDIRHAHSDRRAQLAKAVIDLARAGVVDGSALRDRAVETVRRLEWIRHQAHEIWEAQGRPEGVHDQNWTQAEREWAKGGHDSV